MRAPRKLVPIAAFVAVFGALIALSILYRRELWSIFRSPEDLRSWISSFGATAPLVFVGLQALQVIIFVIPGEVPQVAGGYLFGIWTGTVLSIVGIAAGSSIDFLLARIFGLPFVRLWFKERQIRRAQALANSRRSRIAMFLLFVIPGIPKDILCYVAGLSRMGYLSFLAISMAGRTPGILGSALMGDAAAAQRWVLAGSVFVVSTLLFVVGYLLRDRISRLLERLAHGRDHDPRR